MGKILWCINVYSRLEDMKFLIGQVRSELGCDVLVYCNADDPSPYHVEGVDIFLTGPNSGHHNGARDAVDAALPHLDGYDYVVSSHADNVWNDLSGSISRIIAKMEADGLGAAFMTGDAPVRGAMNDPRNFGYFGDFFLMTVEAYRRCFPILIPLDGKPRGWYEVALADFVHRGIGREKVLDIPARNDHQTHDFYDIMGVPGTWLLGDHDFKKKMQLLEEWKATASARTAP